MRIPKVAASTASCRLAKSASGAVARTRTSGIGSRFAGRTASSSSLPPRSASGLAAVVGVFAPLGTDTGGAEAAFDRGVKAWALTFSFAIAAAAATTAAAASTSTAASASVAAAASATAPSAPAAAVAASTAAAAAPVLSLGNAGTHTWTPHRSFSGTQLVSIPVMPLSSGRPDSPWIRTGSLAHNPLREAASASSLSATIFAIPSALDFIPALASASISASSFARTSALAIDLSNFTEGCPFLTARILLSNDRMMLQRLVVEGEGRAVNFSRVEQSDYHQKISAILVS
mmetsp:Transcript_30012/g.74436  ORF Transcript_30012/g.74436 Transcript_30012/m.74436 type:complete len:289 (-) Transcript_30012:810-1676(-)